MAFNAGIIAMSTVPSGCMASKINGLTTSESMIKLAAIGSTQSHSFTNQMRNYSGGSFQASANQDLEWTRVTVDGSAEDFEMYRAIIEEKATVDGKEEIHKETKYVLNLGYGVKVELSNYGATVTSIMCPDNRANI